MKVRVLIGIFLVAAAPGFAQTNVTGDWDVTINSPQGANTIHVTFKQDGEKLSGLLKRQGGDLPATATLTDEGGKLSGTFGSPMGEVPVSGSLDGKVITLTMVAQTPQGAMNVAMTGDLAGDTIVNGKADVAGMGQMEWSAKRIKQYGWPF